MTADSLSRRLSRLEGDADRSLTLLLQRSGFAVPASMTAAAEAGNPSTSGNITPIPAAQETVSAPGAVNVSVNLGGVTVFLDDERRVWALAKEIKRLIIEDLRRGIGVGG